MNKLGRALNNLRVNSYIALFGIAMDGVANGMRQDWGWLMVNVMGFLFVLGIHRSAAMLVSEYRQETAGPDLMEQAIRNMLARDDQ